MLLKTLKAEKAPKKRGMSALSGLFDRAPFWVMLFRHGERTPFYLNAAARAYCGSRGENLVAKADATSYPRLLEAWQERHARALDDLFEKRAPIKIFDIQLMQGVPPLTAKPTPASPDFHYFKCVYQPLPGKHGEEVIAFGFEIKEELLMVNRMNQTVEGLEKYNERISLILESVSDMFIVLDQDWTITYMNKKMALMAGERRDNLIGQNLWKKFPLYKDSEFSSNVQKVMKEKKMHEFDFYSPPINRWANYRCYPTADGVVLFINDITEKKEMELQKDSFVALASHELKTPIAALKLYTGVLQEMLKGHANSEVMQYIAGIDERINKLTSIINSLLEASHIQWGKLTLSISSFPIDELLKEVVGNISRISRTHRLTLRATSGKTMVADRGRLEQVFTNLINNAVTYSPKGSEVTITVRSRGDNVEVTVTDRGIGIPMADADKIFTTFYQSTDPRRRKIVTGLGLGLSVSKGIVEKHGGTITLKSAPGKGSSFRVTLPAYKIP